MSRLFWKFFLIFWLAQLFTAVVVNSFMWLILPMPPGLSMNVGVAAVGVISAPAPDHAPLPDLSGMSRMLPPPQPPHLPPLPQGALAPQGLPPGMPAFIDSGPPLTVGTQNGEAFVISPPPFPSPLKLILLPVIAGLTVSLLFAALLARYFSRPIRRLREAFSAAAEGRLETRIGAGMGKRRDELADLGRGFDHMAARLQALVETQRRLLHDVSHEMRSPLARLQAATDLIRQQPERDLELIERIERDTRRMDKLVGELLMLARLDVGMGGQPDEEVDLRELVGQVVDDVRFEIDAGAGAADAKTCTIDYALNGPVLVHGSAELLSRAVENILRNAVRYSPPDSVVAVRVKEAPDCRIITIADQGPGVGQNDLEAIFQPFYRNGPDRYAATGHGLGLAIARRVANLHGGKLHAANRPGGGLIVTLELPRQESGDRNQESGKTGRVRGFAFSDS